LLTIIHLQTKVTVSEPAATRPARRGRLADDQYQEVPKVRTSWRKDTDDGLLGGLEHVERRVELPLQVPVAQPRHDTRHSVTQHRTSLQEGLTM